MYDLDLFRSLLHPNSIGHGVRHYPELDSTNSHAKRLLPTESNPHGLIILADRQTAGRGRADRRWITTDDSLAATVVLISPKRPAQLTATPLVAGLALYRAIAAAASPSLRASLRLKWPNDLLINDKKCSGILLESETLSTGNTALLVGIGINITLPPATLPTPTFSLATSLESEGLFYAKERILAAFLNHVTPLWTQFEAEGFLPLMADYLSASQLTGSMLKVHQDRTQVHGRAVRLLESGALVLETPTGHELTVFSGDLA